MSISIDVHDCVATVIEKNGDRDVRWTTYTFIDAKGQKYEITAFEKSPIQALNDKLREFIGERA